MKLIIKNSVKCVRHIIRYSVDIMQHEKTVKTYKKDVFAVLHTKYT